jgi:single-stranded-DNA-specific exonuclease
MTSTTVGFVFVPRINAAGRMGDAARAVELMMTQDYVQAQIIAEELSRENTRRQETELSIYEEAVRILENPGDGTNVVHAMTGPILVRGKDWHPGVIGIVASRLVSRYHRAAIVFTENSGQEGMIKGSARACEGYNILEAILYAQEFTDQFGGHPKAAGISVSAKQYDAFANRIREYEQQNEDEPCVPSVIIDGLLTAADLTLETCREIAFLGPFGEGNREPRFAVRGCKIIRTEICGKGKHLKIRFTLPDESRQESGFDAIAFGLAEHEILYKPENLVDIVLGMSISTWGNRESLSLQIIDIHFSRSGRMMEDSPEILEKLYENNLPFKQMAVLSKESVDKLLPDKESVKAVYQFLRTYCADDISLCDSSLLARYVSANYNISLHGFALLRIVDIFEEAGLLRIYSRKGQRICFTLIFVDGKVKLENTKTYQRLFIEGGNVS